MPSMMKNDCAENCHSERDKEVEERWKRQNVRVFTQSNYNNIGGCIQKFPA
jgi:hypothetical protein